MIVFFDTSVLVPVFYGDHPKHTAALDLFRKVTRRNACCAAHSAVELYSVMTRLPVKPRIPPEQAMLFIENLAERVRLITLEPDEYIEALRSASEKGIAGGTVYDALILACARKSKARAIYTNNIRELAKIAPDLEQRLRSV